MATIVAVSSGRPPAAIAVIRISGRDAVPAATALAGTLPQPREARVRTLRAPDGSILDSALVLVFPGPRSATGEDLVELHCHGGRAVIDAVERALLEQPGVRRAQPGEFTRRALTNGRIDLAEAQGLADLLAAETERQRRAAVGAAGGRISVAVRGWLDRIAALSAAVEAMLDFSDEDDVAVSGDDVVAASMGQLAAEIELVLAAPPVERLRDGISVVLAGPPNIGKSTLLNLLTEREAAIVTPIAGTTRDRIEAPVSHGGIPFVLTDTAGLTETDDPVERIGVARASTAIAEADILLWLADTPPPRDAIWILSKSDERDERPNDRLAVGRDDAGSIAALWSAIITRAEAMIPREDQLAFDQRQRDAAMHARDALTAPSFDLLTTAENLRLAHRALGVILGIDATESMLDALFGRFCIGK
jgi:tRNA modification GTPase